MRVGILVVKTNRVWSNISVAMSVSGLDLGNTDVGGL